MGGSCSVSSLPDPLQLADALNEWFGAHGRNLLWRHPDTSPYGVLVSEVMSQQTPVRRVEPMWRAWMDRWPTPSDLAAASTAEVIRQWANLGYPRRAMRLQDCARACVEKHDGNIPTTVVELEALPGIGSYTARAVAAFAFGQAVPVVDTNVRRVYRRLVDGAFLQGPARARDLRDVADLLPFVDADPALKARRHQPASLAESESATSSALDSSGTSQGDAEEPGLLASDVKKRARREAANLMCASLMELGALVCTARNPRCEQCPIRHMCRWVALGKPQPSEEERQQAKKRVQKFAGTDRQVRGKIMAALREHGEQREHGERRHPSTDIDGRPHSDPVPKDSALRGPARGRQEQSGHIAAGVAEADIMNLWEDKLQLTRCVESLLADGLIQSTESEGMTAYHLPN